MRKDPFVFPESLALVSLEEAPAFVHGGCPPCDEALKLAKKYRRGEALVNLRTRDILGVFISSSTIARREEEERERKREEG